MFQKILNDLTILYIEKDTIKHIDVDTTTSNYASRNTRENCFVRAFQYKKLLINVIKIMILK